MKSESLFGVLLHFTRVYFGENVVYPLVLHDII